MGVPEEASLEGLSNGGGCPRRCTSLPETMENLTMDLIEKLSVGSMRKCCKHFALERTGTKEQLHKRLRQHVQQLPGQQSGLQSAPAAQPGAYRI